MKELPSSPYPSATDQNTAQNWYAGETPIDVRPGDLTSYATNLHAMQGNLLGDQTPLKGLSDLAARAFGQGAFREGVLARATMLANATEFQQFVQYLQVAVFNVAQAAQTVADSYRGVDSTSAVTLDAVDYAFARPGATRPAGLSPLIDGSSTWLGSFLAQRSDIGPVDTTAPSPAGDSEPTTVVQHNLSDGSTTTVYSSVDGYGGPVTRVITIYPDGDTATRTTVVESDGQQLVTTETDTVVRNADGSTDTTEVTDADGQSSTVEVHTTSSRDDTTVTTTAEDAGGGPASRTVETTRRDGSTLTTTTTYDGQGQGHQGDTVATGPETPAPEAPDSPAAKALGQLARGVQEGH